MSMQLHYFDDSIGAICNEPTQSGLDEALVLNLQRQLADLDAAASLVDLVPMGLDLNVMTPDRILLQLTDDEVLVARIDHVAVRRGQDGSVRWDRAHRIQLVKIEHSGGQG